MWISSTIPADWTWLSPGDIEASSNTDTYCTKRLSICELEGDATVDGLLNAQMVSSLFNFFYFIFFRSDQAHL